MDCGSPGRTRTSDPAVNSRLLYLLSYRGTGRDITRRGRFGKVERIGEGGTIVTPSHHPSAKSEWFQAGSLARLG
jgi:hypothetical protein